MIARSTKPPKCKHCKVRMEVAGWPIHAECVEPWWAAFHAKQKAKRARVERAQDKVKREGQKTLPQLTREAQVVFNKWVRARDEKRPCISCGKPPGDMSQLHAGRDAGHYRSVGSASHLRFNEANCHAQCVKCNQWGAGMAVDYRIRLIERIGLRAVEHLETSNDPRKWTREELIAIKSMYAAKLKALRRPVGASGHE